MKMRFGGISKRLIKKRAWLQQHLSKCYFGFIPLVAAERQSPIITTFLYPHNQPFDFNQFYLQIKKQGFVLYPGKVTNLETFRIGNIGHIFPEDIKRLVEVVGCNKRWVS